MDPLPVVVVSSDALTRGGLAAAVAGRGELVVAAQGAPGDVARLVRDHAAAVVLADLGPAPSSAAALAAILPSGVPVVVLTADSAGAAEALRAGARALLLRDASPDAIAAAVVGAARGLAVLDHGLAETFLRTPRASSAAEPLTAREREVLALLAEGFPNKTIADRLRVSEHTAKFHVNAILAKLGASSRADAIVRAARMGLIML